MSYWVKYAGVELPLSTPRVRQLVERALPLEELVEGLGVLLPPWSPWPSRGLAGIAAPIWPAAPRPRIGDFFYPTGASRWATFYGVCDTERKDRIVQSTYPSSATGTPTASTFELRADPEPLTDSLAISGFTTSLFMLPPRPLKVLDPSFEGLWLITLVDERFYWHTASDAGDIQPDDSTITWASLLTATATALGINLTQGTISSTYGYPAADSPLYSHGENAGTILDSLAWNVGKLFVRSMDGTYKLETPDEAQTTITANIPTSPRSRIAGGDSFALSPSSQTTFPQAQAAVLPSAVKVVFPKFILAAGYSDDRPQWHITKQSPGNVYSKTIQTTASSITQAGSYSGTKVFRDVARATYTNSGDPAPTNQTAIDALATQIANDYLRVQQFGLDEVYPGVRAWTPEGIHDILWCYRIDDNKRPTSYTRVSRKPWNFMVKEFQHEIGTSTGTVVQPVTTAQTHTQPVTYQNTATYQSTTTFQSTNTFQQTNTYQTVNNQPHAIYQTSQYTSQTPVTNQTHMYYTPEGIRTVYKDASGVIKRCCIPCQELLDMNKIVWLRMEESFGTAYDSSGNDLHFTASTDAIGTAAGKVVHTTSLGGLGARDLELGSSHYFSRAYSSAWNLSTVSSGFMISVWINLESNPDDMYIISKPAGGGTAWSLYVDNSGSARFTFGGVTTPGGAGVAISLATWYHLVAWYDPADSLIRLTRSNGTAVVSAGAATHSDGSAADVYVGQDGATANYWDGLLDELIVAKYTPTAAARTNFYANNNGTREPDCLPLAVDAGGTGQNY